MKATISLAVFCLVNSVEAAQVQKHLVPIWEKERELNQVHEQMNFKHKSRMAPHMMTERQLEKQAEHYRAIKKDPDTVFGANDAWYYNTRDGGAPGTEINMHDDEPITLGEATMEDSSESGSDGEESPEDMASYKEAIKRADTHAQLSNHYYMMAQQAKHHNKEKKHHH